MPKEKENRTRNYVCQRNYSYETQDDKSKYKGLTEDEWKQAVLDELTCDKLKANHIVLVFHDKDVDDNGMPKPLHVHFIVNFENSLTQTEAIKRTGCSGEKHCTPMDDRSKAYRYLLHITEQAIKDGKHIYGEDELIIRVADGKTFDYHKEIKPSEGDEDEKENKKILNRTIKAIQSGVYGDGSFKFGQIGIYEQLLLDDNINRMLSAKPANKRAIENAIEVKQETYRVEQKLLKK